MAWMSLSLLLTTAVGLESCCLLKHFMVSSASCVLLLQVANYAVNKLIDQGVDVNSWEVGWDPPSQMPPATELHKNFLELECNGMVRREEKSGGERGVGGMVGEQGEQQGIWKGWGGVRAGAAQGYKAGEGCGMEARQMKGWSKEPEIGLQLIGAGGNGL